MGGHAIGDEATGEPEADRREQGATGGDAERFGQAGSDTEFNPAGGAGHAEDAV